MSNDQSRVRRLGRKLSRREFGVLAGGSVLAAACGGNDSGSEPSPTTTAAAAAETPTTAAAAPTTAAAAPTTAAAAPSAPAKVVRFGYHAAATSADTLDPAFRTSSTDAVYQGICYEPLLAADGNLAPKPVLAESWEANDTGTQWTFKLRDGVTFHDGKPFVADDVVYTYQRLLDPDVASPGAGILPGLDPDGIVALDDRTVRFTLAETNVAFPESTISSHTMIVPEGATNADLATRSNGTGAFKIDSFTPGELATAFVRHDGYWQSGQPYIDALEVITIPEPEAQRAALIDGQIDIMSQVGSQFLDELEAHPDIVLAINPIGSSSVAYCQIDVPPFDNNDLRLAIKYASNREQMNLLVNQGRATLMNDIPIPSMVPFGLEGVREHNVERAKEHLSRAGYPDGVDLTLTLADMQDWTQWTTVWQQQLAEAGINLDLNVTPADTYWGDQWLQAPFAMTGWNVRPTVDIALGLWYHSEADWNETHWRREDWDAQLAQARRTLDVTERGAIYRRLQQVIVDEGGHFVTHMFGLNGARRSNVTGWAPSPSTPFFSAIDIS